MTSHWRGAAERRRTAHEKLAAVSGGYDERRRLAVRCRRGHHVAEVFDVDGELVYTAAVGGRGHGRRDRVDVAHHGHARGLVFADLLTPSGDGPADAGEELPASCECGPYLLPRTTLLAAVGSGQRRLTLS